MRLFIGIKVDDKARKKINSYFNLFYENKVTGNYTKVNNLHMTMVFLGETDENKVDTIKEILRSINTRVNDIKISKMKMLKDILIGEVVPNDDIYNMNKELRKKLTESNINFDDGKFYPHVTLIRKARNHEEFIDKDMNIISYFNHLTLFESRRINNELVYIDLSE